MTTIKTIHRRVSKQAGLNPVARAYAKQRLLSAVTTYQISIYMMQQGEQAQSDYRTLATIFAITMEAMTDGSSVDYRKLKAGMSVCAQAALRDFSWDANDAPTLNEGLKIVQQEFPKFPAEAANRAIKKFMG